MRSVVIRKKMSLEDWGLIFFPLYCIVGVFVVVPFYIAVEVKAWLARHRIRKEQAASRATGKWRN